MKAVTCVRMSLAALLVAQVALAGSESDTTVSQIHLKLRSNSYGVSSIRFNDANPSKQISKLHERIFELQEGQTLEVFVDDINPFLFEYPPESCAIVKLTTHNSKIIKVLAALGEGSESKEATAPEEPAKSEDRSATAARGCKREDLIQVTQLCDAKALAPTSVISIFDHLRKKDEKRSATQVVNAMTCKERRATLEELRSKAEQLNVRSGCISYLEKETASKPDCVKEIASAWGDAAAIEEEAHFLVKGVAYLSLLDECKLDADIVKTLRHAAAIENDAKEVAAFLRVLAQVGTSRKVATFSYDRGNHQYCTLKIQEKSGGNAGAVKYYWHGTTRVAVSPKSSYSLGLGAAFVYSFVKQKEIGLESASGGQVRIAEKDASQSTMRGLAVMMTMTPRKWQDADFTPMFEFGVNPKDNLGLYLGAGFQWGSSVSLGAGAAFEQIKVLGAGQRVGDLLSSAGELKTEKQFKLGAYVHLTIGSRDFFKSGGPN